MNQGKVLVVDDEDSLRRVLQKVLEDEGYWVQTVGTGDLARIALAETQFDVSLMDIKLPDTDGLTLLKEVKEGSSDTTVIVMTAQNTMRNAIGAMKNGAFDYITKPFDLDEVLVLVKRAMDSRKFTRDFLELKEEVKKRFEPGVNIIGTSANMQKVYKTIGQVVDTQATILIQGESGTGKELVAKTIHYNSPRWNQPFVAINCAAIPRDLLESELFGHEKGAFTGALERRIGKFELAEGGTLFLDEVGDIPVELQTKLLRVLQDREYSRVGGREVLTANVRILAATNQDLEKAVKEKRFREDLYFRLKVIPIYLPPLRERRGDIALLISYFIDKINREMGIQISGVSPDAQKLLEEHTWPGNVRELENTLIRAAVLSSGPILFPKDFSLQNKPAATTLEVEQLSLEEIIRHKLEDYFRRTEGVDVDNLYSLVIERIERPLIELTLKKTRGNQIRAASKPRDATPRPSCASSWKAERKSFNYVQRPWRPGTSSNSPAARAACPGPATAASSSTTGRISRSPATPTAFTSDKRTCRFMPREKSSDKNSSAYRPTMSIKPKKPSAPAPTTSASARCSGR
ncbi:MAG: sigma 54-interacting transcriptional regulator [Deltaproteobacteria bacterium]|nr:sigma 54-interacting transcriptional regulator [Deltaproteobacteria bacterium]